MSQILSNKQFMAGVIWLGMAGKYLEHNKDIGLEKEFEIIIREFKGTTV